MTLPIQVLHGERLIFIVLGCLSSRRHGIGQGFGTIGKGPFDLTAGMNSDRKEKEEKTRKR